MTAVSLLVTWKQIYFRFSCKMLYRMLTVILQQNSTRITSLKIL